MEGQAGNLNASSSNVERDSGIKEAPEERGGFLSAVFEKLDALLDAGGLARKIVILSVSAICIVLNLVTKNQVFAWLVIVLCGVPIFLEALIRLFDSFDIKADLLVAIALAAAVIIKEYFAAAEVAFIMEAGELLEELTVSRARRGVEKIVRLRPKTTHLAGEGGDSEIEVSAVKPGDILRVYPGEQVPVDGVVLTGSTAVDESIITGESTPVDKEAGDSVSSGTVNTFGTFVFRAEKTGRDSTVERMIRLVEAADASKVPIVGVADRWAGWIVAAALVGAVLAYILTGDAIRAVTVLVVFCPCALVLATPAAIMAAIGNLSGRGMLVQNAEALERASLVRKMAFDKTGTLTRGEMSVVEVKSVNPKYSDSEVFMLAASLERLSEHPIGRAVARSYGENAKKNVSEDPTKNVSGNTCEKSPEGAVKEPFEDPVVGATEKPLDGTVVGVSEKPLEGSTDKASENLLEGAPVFADRANQVACANLLETATANTASTSVNTNPGVGIFPEVSGFRILPGNGVEGEVLGKRVCVSKPIPGADETQYSYHLDKGRTVVSVSVDGVAAGFIALADTLRPASRSAVEGIKREGVVPVLLTGDNGKTARAVAVEAGIEEIRFSQKPEDKYSFVSDSSSRICMVGDGVNDAPALKGAYVGVGMGLGGSDVALEASDIVLVNDKIENLPHLLRLSRRMMRVIRLNIIFSMGINFVAVGAAMAGLLGPVAGALVHNGGSFAVILNSALLLFLREGRSAAA